MNSFGFRLGNIKGVPIRIHYSWFIVAILLTISFAGTFSRDYPYLGILSGLAFGVTSCLLLFGSVLAHELSHALIALRHGVGVRAITLFIFGGAAEITDEPKRARVEFDIAIAGPLASLFLAAMFWQFYDLSKGELPLPFTDIFVLLARMNLILVAFNVVPGFPLDGGRVLRAILWAVWGQFDAATLVASIVGRFFGGLVVLVGVAWIFLLDNLLGGLWFVVIGFFLISAAKKSYEQLLVNKILTGLCARDLMLSDVPCAPAGMRLTSVIDEVVLPNGLTNVPVVDRGRLVGFLDFERLSKRSEDELEQLTALEVMDEEGLQTSISPDDEAIKILPLLAKEGRLPVVSDGVLQGILNYDEVQRRLYLYLGFRK